MNKRDTTLNRHDTHKFEAEAMICTVESETKLKNTTANEKYFNHFPT